MKEQVAAVEWDARVAQERVDTYNKEVRERHLKTFKRRQQKHEQLKRIRADQKNSIDDKHKEPISETDSDKDIYEVIQMKKINQKFSKLMSFDIEQ